MYIYKYIHMDTYHILIFFILYGIYGLFRLCSVLLLFA